MDDDILPLDDSVFADILNEDSEIHSDALIDDSFTSDIGSAVTSTPRGDRNRGRKGTGRGTRGKKVTPPAPRLRCTLCSKTYANQRTLGVHMKVHSMKVTSARAPNLEELRDNMQSLLQAAVEEIQKEPPVGELGLDVNMYCASVLQGLKEGESDEQSELCDYLSTCFHDIFKVEKALFPSGIRSAVYTATNKLLSSSEFRMQLKSNVLFLKEVKTGTLNVFLGCLITHLSAKITIYAMQKMRGRASEGCEVRKKRSDDSMDSDTFKQLVYYIGGSTVSGFLWKGEKYRMTSQTWAVYVDVIKCKFLHDDSGRNACVLSVRSFTEAKDRGGLKHISNEAFDFFIVLFDVLMSLEGADGSLPPNAIENHVLNSDTLICLWDVLARSELTDDQSLDLFVQMAHCSLRVVVKGILYEQRLNEHLKKSYTSVALRARLSK